MTDSITDRIEKNVDIAAPVDRVWTALTDYREFSQWFRVDLEGPFVPGETTAGQMTYPGYEHLRMEVVTTAMEPMRCFAFRWHPYAIDPDVDYSHEPPTLVEFTLASSSTGTLLKVVESGFDALPAARRDEAYRMNEGGWSAQVRNIANHVEDHGEESRPEEV